MSRSTWPLALAVLILTLVGVSLLPRAQEAPAPPGEQPAAGQPAAGPPESAAPAPPEQAEPAPDKPAAPAPPAAAPPAGTDDDEHEGHEHPPAGAPPGAAPGAPGVALPPRTPIPPQAMPGSIVEARQEIHNSKKEAMLDNLWRKSDQAFHDGDYETAIRLHRGIVALDPREIESYSVAAWLLWSLGRRDESLRHLRLGQQKNPRSSEMWDKSGQHYDLLKMRREAMAAYARALQFLPQGEDSHFLRRRYAHALERSGEKARALQIWRALVREFPRDAVDRNNLSRLEKATG